MPNHPKLQPLGEILKAADLISAAQIELALRDQQNYDLRIGEILDLRGWLHQETADFFAEHWWGLLNASFRHPLGYYLQLASLLNEEQIQTILQEQKRVGIRFGAVAVLQGWIKKRTIDYFLESLAPQTTTLSAFQDKRSALSSDQKTCLQKETKTNSTIFTSQSLINKPNINTQLDLQTSSNNKNSKITLNVKREGIRSYANLDQGEEVRWID